MSWTRRGEDPRNDATDLEEHESEAERSLREALRIEPSPALVERVRAELSRPRPVRMSPWLVAATAVLAVGLAVFRSPTATAPGPTRSSPPATQEVHASLPVPTVRTGTGEQVEARPKPRVEGRRHPMREPWPAAEIVVEPGQAEALVQLADLASAGEVTLPDSLLHPEADPGTLLPPEPLRVEPLVIAPLDPPVVAEPGLSGRG